MDKQQPDCSNHKKEIAGISDMKVLAEMIGDLHYETLSDLLQHLEVKIMSDYKRDNDAGRKELAMCLWDASIDIGCAAKFISRASQICIPFMNKTQSNAD